MRWQRALLGAWRTIYLAHDRCSPAGPTRPQGSGRQTPSLDRAPHALDDVCFAAGHDHEWAADLQRVRALRGARWTLLLQCVPGPPIPGLEPARRLARGSVELALRADVAAHRRGRVVRLVSRLQRRMAVAAVPPARHPRRDRDAEVLPAATEGPPAPGKAQPAPEARLHVHRAARHAVGPDRI